MTPQSSPRHLGRACWLEDSPCWDEVGIAETVLVQERDALRASWDATSSVPSGRAALRVSRSASALASRYQCAGVGRHTVAPLASTSPGPGDDCRGAVRG